MPDPHANIDVLILGGGLAGLSLAIELKRRDPAIAVTVLERNTHPAPEAAFKVGESTVEIGAHYFSTVLGLREHLDSRQVRKFGFRFFFSDGREDVDATTEVGVREALPMMSWQLDRGRFENFLGEHAASLGVDFRHGCKILGVELAKPDSDDAHQVRHTQDGVESVSTARWVVDASGRAALLKRKLGLAKTHPHDANAAWWRVEGRLDPGSWSSDHDWMQRCQPPERWRSTNHLCGPGYWFWMIPLASDVHSLGIVCDAQMHPLDTINSHDKAMAWLREHQPRVAQALDAPEHAVRDFRFLRHFSHDCEQVFSADRWAITGEAGLFLDPFYSPGSDFIAISNGYICELIEKDRAAARIGAHAELYQQLLFSFFDNTMSLYQDQYPLFGDALVMPLKVVWDYTYYWSVLAPLYTAGRIADLSLLGRLRKPLERATALNKTMQPLLRAWGQANAAAGYVPPDGRELDQSAIGWFRDLNGALLDSPDDAELYERIGANVTRMEVLAAEMTGQAIRQHPTLAAISPADFTVADGTIGLLPPVWYGLADDLAVAGEVASPTPGAALAT
ncbi:tryptophan 7-halogenase [Lysobacter sp. H23M47]|uniref:NAD(P)/FAD-dependent oxidoreductase n=1 Tax=Lysobacter sp. H23M47 TaxID=2781024 RepID=UPI00188205DF|nr:tryptophan 7-halogenase [Lysobacter sp. H23M47]